MKKFKYIDGVDKWLKPMDYEEFWYVIKDYYLGLSPREGCDQKSRDDEVDEETILYGLNSIASMTLTLRHDLNYRPVTPWLKVVE